ncbi:MAG: hypothetical protein ACON4T_01555 [Synechococcus sp.]
MPRPILKLLQSLILVTVLVTSPLAATATNATADRWLCDGDPLTMVPIKGSVDFNGLPNAVPNQTAGTVPGDGVLISWRGRTIQLPRTNNAGAPSYTDGRWWWRAADPDHPEWKQRRGEIIAYNCTAAQPMP